MHGGAADLPRAQKGRAKTPVFRRAQKWTFSAPGGALRGASVVALGRSGGLVASSFRTQHVWTERSFS